MGKKKLSDLTQRYVEDYWGWRLAYWGTDEGKARIAYNPTRGKNPNAKTKSSNNVKQRPAYNSIADNMHKTAVTKHSCKKCHWG